MSEFGSESGGSDIDIEEEVNKELRNLEALGEEDEDDIDETAQVDDAPTANTAQNQQEITQLEKEISTTFNNYVELIRKSQTNIDQIGAALIETLKEDDHGAAREDAESLLIPQSQPNKTASNSASTEVPVLPASEPELPTTIGAIHASGDEAPQIPPMATADVTKAAAQEPAKQEAVTTDGEASESKPVDTAQAAEATRFADETAALASAPDAESGNDTAVVGQGPPGESEVRSSSQALAEAPAPDSQLEPAADSSAELRQADAIAEASDAPSAAPAPADESRSKESLREKLDDIQRREYTEREELDRMVQERMSRRTSIAASRRASLMQGRTRRTSVAVLDFRPIEEAPLAVEPAAPLPEVINETQKEIEELRKLQAQHNTLSDEAMSLSKALAAETDRQKQLAFQLESVATRKKSILLNNRKQKNRIRELQNQLGTLMNYFARAAKNEFNNERSRGTMLAERAAKHVQKREKKDLSLVAKTRDLAKKAEDLKRSRALQMQKGEMLVAVMFNIESQMEEMREILATEEAINLEKKTIRENQIREMLRREEEQRKIELELLMASARRFGRNIEDLSMLETFIADSNKLEHIPNFKNARGIKVINVDNNLLSNIHGLEVLDSLKGLSISNNRLTELDVTELKDLKQLNAAGNNLTTVTGIENLVELRSLDLSDNPLSGVDFLENAKNLQVVVLRNTTIARIPKFDFLRVLTYLDMSKNNFDQDTQLDYLENCSGLQYLDLSNNFFGLVPKIQAHMLFELVMNNNKIRSLRMPTCMPMLTVIRVEENCIEKIDVFANVPFLRELYLRDNMILDTENLYSLAVCEFLEALDLTRNPITYHRELVITAAILFSRLKKLNDWEITTLRDFFSQRPVAAIRIIHACSRHLRNYVKDVKSGEEDPIIVFERYLSMRRAQEQSLTKYLGPYVHPYIEYLIGNQNFVEDDPDHDPAKQLAVQDQRLLWMRGLVEQFSVDFGSMLQSQPFTKDITVSLALQSLAHKAWEYSVLHIQSAWRGRKIRRCYKIIVRAIRRFQIKWKGICRDRRMADTKRIIAATYIQKWWRGYSTRKKCPHMSVIRPMSIFPRRLFQGAAPRTRRRSIFADLERSFEVKSFTVKTLDEELEGLEEINEWIETSERELHDEGADYIPQEGPASLPTARRTHEEPAKPPGRRATRYAPMMETVKPLEDHTAETARLFGQAKKKARVSSIVSIRSADSNEQISGLSSGAGSTSLAMLPIVPPIKEDDSRPVTSAIGSDSSSQSQPRPLGTAGSGQGRKRAVTAEEVEVYLEKRNTRIKKFTTDLLTVLRDNPDEYISVLQKYAPEIMEKLQADFDTEEEAKQNGGEKQDDQLLVKKAFLQKHADLLDRSALDSTRVMHHIAVTEKKAVKEFLQAKGLHDLTRRREIHDALVQRIQEQELDLFDIAEDDETSGLDERIVNGWNISNPDTWKSLNKTRLRYKALMNKSKDKELAKDPEHRLKKFQDKVKAAKKEALPVAEGLFGGGHSRQPSKNPDSVPAKPAVVEKLQPVQSKPIVQYEWDDARRMAKKGDRKKDQQTKITAPVKAEQLAPLRRGKYGEILNVPPNAILSSRGHEEPEKFRASREPVLLLNSYVASKLASSKADAEMFLKQYLENDGGSLDAATEPRRHISSAKLRDLKKTLNARLPKLV